MDHIVSCWDIYEREGNSTASYIWGIPISLLHEICKESKPEDNTPHDYRLPETRKNFVYVLNLFFVRREQSNFISNLFMNRIMIQFLGTVNKNHCSFRSQNEVRLIYGFSTLVI